MDAGYSGISPQTSGIQTHTSRPLVTQPGEIQYTQVTTTTTTTVPRSKMGPAIAILVMLLGFQILMGFMYGFFVRFDYLSWTTDYPRFQDINVMVFVGFAFILSYLRTSSWSGIAMNLLLAAISVQLFVLIWAFWTQVFQGFWTKVPINHAVLVIALYQAASAIIAFSPFHGSATVPQLIIFAFIYNVLYGLNYALINSDRRVVDIGGSIGVFTFAGVCGLVAGLIAYARKPNPVTFPEYEISHLTYLFSFLGALFVFVYFPSWNGGLCPNEDCRVRAALNTTVSMVSAVMITFAFETMLRRGALQPQSILSSILAGGVIMGSCAAMIGNFFLSVIWGCVGAAIATIGFRVITPALNRIGVHDPLGIVNTYMLPGIIGGIFSSFIAAKWYNELLPFGFRTNSSQGGMQLGCLGISVGIALGAGIFIGLIMRLWPSHNFRYDDRDDWIDGIFK